MKYLLILSFLTLSISAFSDGNRDRISELKKFYLKKNTKKLTQVEIDAKAELEKQVARELAIFEGLDVMSGDICDAFSERENKLVTERQKYYYHSSCQLKRIEEAMGEVDLDSAKAVTTQENKERVKEIFNPKVKQYDQQAFEVNPLNNY